MALNKKTTKTLLSSGAALASIAGIGLFVKKYISRNGKDAKNDTKNKEQIARLSPKLAKNYRGVKIDLPEYYEKLLDELPEPKLLFKHFMTCLATPRPSGKCDKIRAALKKTAQALNIEYTQDEIGNVCLKKKGSKGYEDATGVIIQCHMDMVCTSTEDCKFDFDNDSIQGYIDPDDSGWLKARGTTLGADDGIGVAAGLALMEHPNLIHGPIELLITVDEETSLIGAKKLAKAPFLTNKVLINVDSEESHRICIGCAGAFDKSFRVKMNKSIIKNKDKYKVFKINIKNLCGGHTGLQIHLGRANAIQLLCRILNYLTKEKKIGAQLVEISGGNARNAIPSYSNCTIIIPKEDSNKYEEAVSEYWLNYIIPEFKDIETKMHMDSSPILDFAFDKTKVCDLKSSQILISLMMNVPHGVVRYSPTVDGLVQTSIAFTTMGMKCEDDKAKLGLLARSMSMNEMLELDRKLSSLADLFVGCDVEVGPREKSYPGWNPVTSSPALDSCKNAHISLFGEEADVYAVHAGLECGLIKAKYPEMDCVSIGPHISGAHSTDEKLELKTTEPFYNWLVETVTRIAQKH